MLNKSFYEGSKRHLLNAEDEPPDKKLISDGDIFIKQLAAKQACTKTTLAEQLQSKKEFHKASEFTSLKNYPAGPSSLDRFNAISLQNDEVEKLQSLGLSKEDVELYMAKGKGEDYLKCLHKNMDSVVLEGRLREIEGIIARTSSIGSNIHKTNHDRQQETKTMLSSKPDSVETKLLKFALESSLGTKDKIPHPMDDIFEISTNLETGLTQPLDIKKIRRKARSLQKQLQDVAPELREPSKKFGSNTSLTSNSKWDVKVLNEHVKPAVPLVRTVEKIYTCKPQHFYTIKEGNIVKIGPPFETDNHKPINADGTKVTEDEIRRLPKFKNYERGVPTNVLYVKNVANGVAESDLEALLEGDFERVVSVKVMKGKMRGQAFIQFSDEATASKILDELFGVVLKGKPLIVQYGKSKTV